MKINVNNEDYDVVLLETEAGLIILVDDEPFSISLANETHDALGRFASKAGSAVKKVAPKVTKGVVGGAISGGIFGGIGGALKEGISGDREQGGALKRAKIGLIKGAIRGAKKGAMRKLVKNTLDIGAEHAGSYGWAVKAVGGLSIAVVGKKKGFGLEPGDFQAIGREMFAGGFSEFVSANLEAEPVVMLEEDFKQTVGQLAMMIADFLETSEEEYMGIEEGAGLEDLGFIEKDGIWYLHREDAEELLASLLAYGETKLEQYEEETVKLFNPFHDERGRFTFKIGGRTIFRGPERGAFQLKGDNYANAAFKVAGVSGTTYKVLDHIYKNTSDPKVKQGLQMGKNVAGVTGLAAGGLGGFLKAAVYGRASVNNFAQMGQEIRREATYKGENKKPVLNRLIDSFNFGRKGLGYAGLSTLGVMGGITASMLLYRAFGGKGKVSDSLYNNLNKAGNYASQVMGEGWMTRMAGMFGFNLEEHPLLKLFENQEVVEGILTFWVMASDAVESGEGIDLGDFTLTPEQTADLHTVLTTFVVGFLEDADETKLTLCEEDTVRLFNPYHDALGRFTTAKGVASVTNVVGKVAGVSGGIASNIVNREANRRYKERYGNVSFSDWWSGEQGK